MVALKSSAWIVLSPTLVTTVFVGTPPLTAFVAGTTTLLSIFIGFFFGFYAAFDRDGFADRVMPVTWRFLASIPKAGPRLAKCLYLPTLWWFPHGFGLDPNTATGWTPIFLSNVLHPAVLPPLIVIGDLTANFIADILFVWLNLRLRGRSVPP